MWPNPSGPRYNPSLHAPNNCKIAQLKWVLVPHVVLRLLSWHFVTFHIFISVPTNPAVFNNSPLPWHRHRNPLCHSVKCHLWKSYVSFSGSNTHPWKIQTHSWSWHERGENRTKQVLVALQRSCFIGINHQTNWTSKKWPKNSSITKGMAIDFGPPVEAGITILT